MKSLCIHKNETIHMKIAPRNNCNKFLVQAVIVCATLFAFTYCFGQPQPQKPEFRKYNPSYHYYPSGDPTGLFYINGKYYNNWGGAYSTDLVHWKYSPFGREALRFRLSDSTLPKTLRDSLMARMPRLGGSGTVIVDWNNTSGFGKDGKPPLISLWHNDTQPWGNQVVGLAYSNDTAKTWIRYDKFRYWILTIGNSETRWSFGMHRQKSGLWQLV